MHNIYNFYFNNIYIKITATCFDAFVSFSGSSKSYTSLTLRRTTYKCIETYRSDCNTNVVKIKIVYIVHGWLK